MTYYVVESGKQMLVFKTREKAVKKQGALLLACREPVSMRIFKQQTLFDYIQQNKTNKQLIVED